jgi:hypothetical protein
LNSAPLKAPATAQIVAVPPVSAETSGLAVPSSVVMLKRGTKSAVATPMRALAATSYCSALRRSGRRSSGVDGNPTVTTGTIGCAYIGVPRGIGPGARPSRMLIWFSLAVIWLSSRGMAASA